MKPQLFGSKNATANNLEETVSSKNDTFNRKLLELGADNQIIAKELQSTTYSRTNTQATRPQTAKVR